MTPTSCPTIELETGNLPTQRSQTPDFSSRPLPRTRRRAHQLIERGTDQIRVFSGRNVRAPHAARGVGGRADNRPAVSQPPGSGRPLVEQFPRQIPAPGGRPDPTTPEDS